MAAETLTLDHLESLMAAALQRSGANARHGEGHGARARRRGGRGASHPTALRAFPNTADT